MLIVGYGIGIAAGLMLSHLPFESGCVAVAVTSAIVGVLQGLRS